MKLIVRVESCVQYLYLARVLRLGVNHLSDRGKKGRFFGTRGGGLPYKSEGGALHLDLG